MTIRKVLKILLSLLIAVFFLWLALRGVELGDLGSRIAQVKTGWILPFTFVLLASHFLRAERWGLLLSGLENQPARSTLFAGVMVGYMMNSIFPRLGEVSRPVYVARQAGVSTGNLLGTIVLERIIDLACLAGLLVFVTLWLVSDRDIISQIFGMEAWTTGSTLLVPALLLVLIVLILTGYRVLVFLVRKKKMQNPLLVSLLRFSDFFWQGLTAVRSVKNWPLFIVYTAGIWVSYILMSYLPFRMLDLHIIYELGLAEATIVTVISAVGISVPTPGGIGSYHLFVQQSLWLLYSVPLVTALTYATVAHAVTLILIFPAGGLALWFDKYYILNKKLIR